MNVLDDFPWVGERFECVKLEGSRASAACPLKCHRNARVSFWRGSDGRLMFGCWACGAGAKLEILRAAGAGWKDCFPGGVVPERFEQEVAAQYPYHDENKRVLYQTIRLEPGFRGRDKDFRQRRPKPGGGWVWNLEGVRRILYRLPDLLSAPRDQPVFVVAGEKDADNLRAVGLTATTNVCGERSEWLDSYSDALCGRDVIVVEDRDSAGRRHAHEVCGSLMERARSLRRVRFPEKDATAFLMRLRQLDVSTPTALREYVLGVVDESPKWSATG